MAKSDTLDRNRGESRPTVKYSILVCVGVITRIKVFQQFIYHSRRSQTGLNSSDHKSESSALVLSNSTTYIKLSSDLLKLNF